MQPLSGGVGLVRRCRFGMCDETWDLWIDTNVAFVSKFRPTRTGLSATMRQNDTDHDQEPIAEHRAS